MIKLTEMFQRQGNKVKVLAAKINHNKRVGQPCFMRVTLAVVTTAECRRRCQDKELQEQLSTARAQQDWFTADVWSVSFEEVGAPQVQSRSTRRLDETDSSDAASNAQRKRQNHVRHASDEEANEELPRQKQVRRSGDVSLDTPTGTADFANIAKPMRYLLQEVS